MIRLSLVVFLLAASPCAFARQDVPQADQPTQGTSPAHPSVQDPAQQDPSKPSAPEPKTPQETPSAPEPKTAPDTPQVPAGDANKSQQASGKQGDQGEPIPPSQQQPKRILGIMPNYRAVSAGAIPPPPTAKQSFMIATRNSFDYSAFVFVGLTSLIAKGTDAHPQLGKGPMDTGIIIGAGIWIRPTEITW